MQSQGLRKHRTLEDSSVFLCKICHDLILKPKQCFDCGGLFCEQCIGSVLRSGKTCPEGCNNSSIKDISAGLKRIYHEIDIKCVYHSSCNRVLKISDIEVHEEDCQAPPCNMKALCNNNLTKNKKFNKSFCSPECYVLGLMKTIQDSKVLYITLSKVIPIVEPELVLLWDETYKADFIKVMDNRLKAQNAPVVSFVSAITKAGFTSGEHYWEILDNSNECLIKVGVTTTRQNNYKAAFCDVPSGYAYYALGQLRNGSDSKGPAYATKSHQKNPIGVYLNMDAGILGFVINGEYYGPAYVTPELTKGEIFPAIAFLKAIDCTIVSKPVPLIIRQRP